MNILHQNSRLNSVSLYAFITMMIVVFTACKKNETIKSENNKIASKDTIAPSAPKFIVTYTSDTLQDENALKAFKEKYTLEQQKIIAATNRIDLNRIRIKSALVIPDTMLQSFMDYTPFPAGIEKLINTSKFILVNQRIQLFALYESGKLIRTGPVSSGRKSKPTPNGLFHTNFKARKKISTIDGSWVMPYYFNIINRDGVALHQFTLPGYPASHSCIRMYEEDAKFIYNWADQWQLSADGNTVVNKGTPVLLFGTYDFDGIASWKMLPQDANAVALTKDELAVLNETIEML